MNALAPQSPALTKALATDWSVEPSAAVSYPVVYQDTYGIRGSQMIFEAADEVFRVSPRNITHGECLVAAEAFYFDLMDRDDLSADMLGEEVANNLGFNFCRLSGRLILED